VGASTIKNILAIGLTIALVILVIVAVTLGVMLGSTKNELSSTRAELIRTQTDLANAQTKLSNPQSALTNLTEDEVNLIVLGTLGSNSPQTSFSFQTEFKPTYRQWHVAILTDKSQWGHVYLVDDATGKVINP
jgi:hypothetical protein